MIIYQNELYADEKAITGMTEETFLRYRKLIDAMKERGLASSASDAVKKLNDLQARKNLTQVELLDKLGF